MKRITLKVIFISVAVALIALLFWQNSAQLSISNARKFLEGFDVGITGTFVIFYLILLARKYFNKKDGKKRRHTLPKKSFYLIIGMISLSIGILISIFMNDKMMFHVISMSLFLNSVIFNLLFITGNRKRSTKFS